MKTLTERILAAVDHKIAATIEPTNRYIPVVMPNGMVTLENELNLTIRTYGLMAVSRNMLGEVDCELGYITRRFNAIEIAYCNDALYGDPNQIYFWREVGEA